VVESHNDFPGVEISIAGDVGEMVRVTTATVFSFFFFFFFFKSSAFVFLRYKDSMHL